MTVREDKDPHGNSFYQNHECILKFEILWQTSFHARDFFTYNFPGLLTRDCKDPNLNIVNSLK